MTEIITRARQGRVRRGLHLGWGIAAIFFSLSISAHAGPVHQQFEVSNSSPTSIVAGPAADGGIWYASSASQTIYRFDPARPEMPPVGYPITGATGFFSRPQSLIVGPDNMLWFTLPDSRMIGKMTTSGAVTLYTIGQGFVNLTRAYTITFGPDGALWFTDRFVNQIGRMTTDGTVTHKIATNSDPANIVAGPDNAVWFTQWDGKIGRIDVSTKAYTETEDIGADGDIIKGPDGSLWFSGFRMVGRLTTAGVVTNFELDTFSVTALTVGPDGNVWVLATAALFKITAAGTVREFPLGIAFEQDITVGRDGALWYSGQDVDVIGRVIPPVAGDVDADGRSDILWRASGGSVGVSSMNGAQAKPFRTLGWRAPVQEIVATGDFDDDGDRDIMWRHTTAGQVQLWTLKDGQYEANKTVVSSTGTAMMLPTSWKPAGVGDFDGDGKSDVLWRNIDGGVRLWLMDGAKVKLDSTCAFLQATNKCVAKPDLLNWRIQGVGDFDGDGRSDILWRDNTGHVAIWFMKGVTIEKTPYINLSTPVASTMQIVGVADFDNDGRADILWRESGTGVRFWLMFNNAVKANLSIGTMGAGWSVVGTGDYNADGRSDILWHQSASGGVVLWQIVSGVLTAKFVQTLPTNWKVQK